MKLVAENLTITHRTVAEAVAARDSRPIREIAAASRRAGAVALDVNLGPRRQGLSDALDFVLEALAGAWEGALWIDGSDPAAMARAADRWPHGVALNGYSGNRGREGVLKLAAERDLDLVVFLMTDAGIPRTVEERLALLAELAGRAGEAGIAPERLIIDPVVAPMGWMDGQELNAGLIKVLRSLPEVLGGEPRSVVGLSNLLTRSTGRDISPWLKDSFLAFAAGAGLTHVMADVADPGLVRAARAIEAFEGARSFAPEEFRASK